MIAAAGRPAADAVADNDPDAVVVDLQHVVPVATDLQRWHSGFVADGETRRRLQRRQHRPLQRERCLARALELADMLDGQTEMADENGDQQSVFGGHPARHPKLEPQRNVSGAGEHHDQSLCLADLCPATRPSSRSAATGGGRPGKCHAAADPLCASVIRWARPLPRWSVHRRRGPHHRDHPMYVERSSALVESDRQHLGHGLGHTDRRGQSHDRAFPGREGPFAP